MTARYPSLSQRRQAAKHRDRQMREAVEASKGFDANRPEPAPEIWYANNLQPTLPGMVHGIVSVDPPGVQCDGCGYVHTSITLPHAVQFGPRFNSHWYFRTPGDQRRLCDTCATHAWG